MKKLFDARGSQQQRAGPPRRVRYDARRLLDQHGCESDPENVDKIPSSTDSDSTVEEMSESSSNETSSSPNRINGGSTNKRKRKKIRRIESDSEDSVPRAGPSSGAVEVEIETEPETTSRAEPKKKRVVADVGGLEEIPEAYRPPDWLSEVMPKRSPYFPQLGDDLVYFRQGHELYVKQLETSKICEILRLNQNMVKLLPFNQVPDLPPEISVRVVNIKFELSPPRVVVLTLERTDWETGESIGGLRCFPRAYPFTIRYHDMPSVLGFFVLRQNEKSVRHHWNAGDSFRFRTDRTWWLGKVLRKEPFSQDFPDSNFRSYWIKWDGGYQGNQEDKQLSHWDMEIITDDFVIPTETKDGIPASDEDLRNGLYEVRPEDWEPHGHQDAECQRISNLVTRVMDLSVAEPFLTPVDLNAYPDYAFQIEYPIDLNTIKSRLDNLFYRRTQAILTDIEHIAINAEKFNEPGSGIVRSAKIISSLLREIVHTDDLNERTVSEVYHRLAEQYCQSPQAAPKLKVLEPVVRSTGRPSSDGPSDQDKNQSFISGIIPPARKRTISSGDSADSSEHGGSNELSVPEREEVLPNSERRTDGARSDVSSHYRSILAHDHQNVEESRQSQCNVSEDKNVYTDIRTIVTRDLTEAGYQTIIEDVVEATEEERMRKKVIVFFNQSLKIGFLADFAIRLETSEESCREFDEERKHIYQPLISQLIEKYDLMELHVIGLLIGVHGTASNFFRDFRVSFNLPETLTTEIISTVQKEYEEVFRNHFNP